MPKFKFGDLVLYSDTEVKNEPAVVLGLFKQRTDAYWVYFKNEVDASRPDRHNFRAEEYELKKVEKF